MLEARQVPIDMQTIARLFRRPESIGDNRNSTAFRERYFKHIAHAVEAASLPIVDTLHTSAKNRRVRHQRDLHTRQIEIQPKLLRTVTLRAAVETRHFLADEAKVGRVLQSYRWRNWFTRGLVRELRVRRRTIAWSIHDAVFSATLIGCDFPAIRSRSDEHRARLGAELAILLKRMRDRSRSADHLNTKHRILVNVRRRREFANNPGPVGIHLVGKNHRQRSLHTLSKLEPVNCDHNVAVATHVNKRV